MLKKIFLGMGYRPHTTVEKTLIKFEQGEKSSYQKYIDDIESFLKGNFLTVFLAIRFYITGVVTFEDII